MGSKAYRGGPYILSEEGFRNLEKIDAMPPVHFRTTIPRAVDSADLRKLAERVARKNR